MLINEEVMVKTVQEVVGAETQAAGPIALHEPKFASEEADAVMDCLESGWTSSAGFYVKKFEDDLAEYCGASHAIACVNGTSALHMALHLVGVAPEEEVIVPAISFIATANAVLLNGAVPHFVDISEDDFGIDPQKLDQYLNEIAEFRNDSLFNKETGRRIAAILPVHCFGFACKIHEIVELGQKWGLPVVEDAAEALGSFQDGKALGTFGRASILSFNGNKIITAGGGGVILTQDDKLAEKARHLTTTAKKPHPWRYQHDELGYNYRLPSLNAALGVGQLRRMDTFLSRKKALFEKYKEAFSSFSNVRLLEGGKNSSPNYWLNTVVFDKNSGVDTEKVLQLAYDNGLMLRPVWDPLPMQPHLKTCPAMDWPVARSLAQQTICLPSSYFL